MFCTRVAWVGLVRLLLCKDEGSSPVSLQLLRGGLLACKRCHCLCRCWALGCWPTSICVSNILVRNESPREPMCFRYLIFSCQDLVSCYFCFVLLPLGRSCGECNVVSLYVLCCSVNVFIWFVGCVSDRDCELFVETIRNMLGGGWYFVV